jgi:Zn-finger nucleic acid-binding protein
MADNAEDHTGYGCSTCQGSWLPQKFINSIKYSKDFEPKEFFNDIDSKVSGQANKRCPSNCGWLSTIGNTEGISYCVACHGVWFERDALKDMLKRYRNKQSSMVGADTPNIAVGFFDILGVLFK